MEEWWKETMTPKNLGLVEEKGKPKPKPKPKPLANAWEQYKEAQMEAQITKRRLCEEAQKSGRVRKKFNRDNRHLRRSKRRRQCTHHSQYQKKKTIWTKTRRSPKPVQK